MIASYSGVHVIIVHFKRLVKSIEERELNDPDPPVNWHRLFGIMLCDLFTDSPYRVELEKDLSVQQQRLDIVVIRKTPGIFSVRLPDGLDELADHNLISFKSYQEAFGAWTGEELIGHYVTYRKLLQASDQPMLPPEHFRLFGVCARYPARLAAQMKLTEKSPGVYDSVWGVRTIRLIVLRDLPDDEHNAPLHLFSADRAKVEYGQEHFSQRSPKSSSFLSELFGSYQREGVAMPYTLDDYYRESCERVLKGMTIEERLEGVPLEKRLEGLSVEELEAYLKKLKSAEKSDE